MTTGPRRILIAQAALALLAFAVPKVASAAPQTLDCVLTDIEIKSSGVKFESQVGGEKRAMTVIFDEDAKTLVVKQDGTVTPLRNIAISQTSMTAAGDNISLGIDRSSWLIAFQTYGKADTRNEFGVCSLQH